MALPSKLTRDESRAIAFVALLLAVSAGARVLDRPAPLEIDGPQVDIDELEAASRRQRELDRPLGPVDTIDPNTAAAEQIARLPGASRAIADRVVAEREQSPFRTTDDLRRVRGIGPATVEKWRPHLRLPAAAPILVGEAAASRPLAGAGDAARAGPIDLNRATAVELQKLPGIGAVLAGRIVAWRDSVGRFTAVDQLEEVRGVGPAMMRRLAPLVRIGG
jgi:competence ComEA-like helix-hairpin-helix protein